MKRAGQAPEWKTSRTGVFASAASNWVRMPQMQVLIYCCIGWYTSREHVSRRVQCVVPKRWGPERVWRYGQDMFTGRCDEACVPFSVSSLPCFPPETQHILLPPLRSTTLRRLCATTIPTVSRAASIAPTMGLNGSAGFWSRISEQCFVL